MKQTHRFSRILCGIFALLLCLPLFGCEDGPQKNPPEEDPNLPRIDLIADGNVMFCVVRSDTAQRGDPALAAAIDIRTYLNSMATGQLGDIDTDWKGGKDPEAREILVGLIDNDASRELCGSLGYGEYAVALSGNKILIAGFSDEALQAAEEAFKAVIERHLTHNDVENTVVSVPVSELQIRGVVNEALSGLPRFGDRTYTQSVIETEHPAYQLLFEDVSADDVTDYGYALEDAGFAVISESPDLPMPEFIYQSDTTRVFLRWQKNEKKLSVFARETESGAVALFGLCVKDSAHAYTEPKRTAADAGITLSKYDTVEVLTTDETGWYLCKKDGKTGYFRSEEVRGFETMSQVKNYAAVVWARDIAADNEFHYGDNAWAHKHGCYFCGTNGENSAKVQAGAAYEDQLKTYCCNPFVTAAVCHGGGAVKLGTDITQAINCISKKINLANDKNEHIKDTKYFAELPKPRLIKDLQPGDILLTPTHAMIVSERGQIVDAAGGDDNVLNSDRWDNSIREHDSGGFWSSVTRIYRYIGE